MLVRHAHAGTRDPIHYADDTMRPITEKGRATQQRVGRYLHACGIVPTLILSSPWLRAMQTAELLADAFPEAARPTIVPCPPLTGSPNLRALARVVEHPAAGATLAFVGHQPWLGQLASALLTGSATAMELDFPKSGVVGIEASHIGRGKGSLRFFIRPPMLPQPQ
ncbi:MAG TPA: histidine phosphatase family protein [Gemmatimonadales bacterium]|nr:histidine phosphatase family protein [Gemmatimonadales bacterium]